MADPIIEPVSWAALELVKARIQQITKARGYYSDIGAGLVTLDPREDRRTADEILTLISATDVTENEDSSGPRTSVSDMDLTIEATVPFDATDNPALVAHRARADICRALREGVRDAALGLRSVKTTGSRFAFANDGGAVVIAQVTARAGLAETTPPAP
ncbi:MAG TPA: hypothetical protein VGE09_16905 [Pseudoxanthomonas sp.]